jgi:hypothetical protein
MIVVNDKNNVRENRIALTEFFDSTGRFIGHHPGTMKDWIYPGTRHSMLLTLALSPGNARR